MVVASVREAVAAAIDLVLPGTCAGCDLPGPAVCVRCRAELADLALADPGPVTPVPRPADWPGCTGTVQYAGVSARLMKAFKDGDRLDLGDLLGRLLTDAVRRQVTMSPFDPGRRPVLLVPIPSDPAAVRRRGERPTRLLARRAAHALGPAVSVVPALSMARRTQDQAGLDREQRLDNLRGAMRVRSPRTVRGQDCVLVDDVLTSGATLSEGRRALLAAGAARVGMSVCMVTPRRSSPSALPFRRPAD